MIRIEYSIDGINYNHITKDFETESDADEYIKVCEMKQYSKSIRKLTVTQVKQE